MIMNPLEQLIRTLTFEKCYICQIHEGPICDMCVDQLGADIESRCYICNKLTKQNKVCTSHGSALRRAWWLGAYEGRLKDLIAAMKLGRGREIARRLGASCAVALPYLSDSTIVSAVPTAPQRVRRRGFDHSTLIAAGIAAHKGLPCRQLLKRTSNSDQIGKSRADRIKQVKHVFSAPTSLNGASILLVDDIITTGATVEAAARCLRDAGAVHVDAIVVARHLLK